MGHHGERGILEAGLSGMLTLSGHRLMARVDFADTYFSGVVYHARYLEFLERGRSDFLRLSGIHHTELTDGKHGERIVWVVRRLEIDFHAPARIDDILTVETRAARSPAPASSWRRHLMRDDELLIAAQGRSGDHRRARPPEALSEGMDRPLHAEGLRRRPGRQPEPATKT